MGQGGLWVASAVGFGVGWGGGRGALFRCMTGFFPPHVKAFAGGDIKMYSKWIHLQ